MSSSKGSYRFRVCDVCGITYPILLGPMYRVSRSGLVLAMSRAGGLGILAASGMTETEFRDQTFEIRRHSDFPFAVNIPWADPNSDNIANWVIEEEVKIIVSSAGFSEDGLERILSAGCRVFQVVSSIRQAVQAVAFGVDGIIAKGYESGGVNATNSLSTFALTPQIVDSVTVPVIVAGGIADGRGMAAAFALGAEGILMGTRLLASVESTVDEAYKRAIINAGDTSTSHFNFGTFSIHLLRNKHTDELKHSRSIIEHAWQLIQELDPEEVDPTTDLMTAGQIAGMVKNCEPVGIIIRKIIEEFKKVGDRLEAIAAILE